MFVEIIVEECVLCGRGAVMVRRGVYFFKNSTLGVEFVVEEGAKTSFKNSTLDAEFVGKGGEEISSTSSTLDVELEGEGGSSKSNGTGE